MRIYLIVSNVSTNQFPDRHVHFLHGLIYRQIAIFFIEPVIFQDDKNIRFVFSGR